MISKLEKLLLGITAALTFGCGEEAAEQCREGREWNGSECVAVGYDAGRDQVDEVIDLSSEEPQEESCLYDSSFDGCGQFQGMYEVISSTCSLITPGNTLQTTYIGFQPREDCMVRVTTIGAEENTEEILTCYNENGSPNGGPSYNRTPRGNVLLFPQNGMYEFTLCRDFHEMSVSWQEESRDCLANLQYDPGNDDLLHWCDGEE